MQFATAEVLNSRTFQSLQRRANIFLTPPEIMKLFDTLVEEKMWWDAFLEMVRDFEILTELPEKEFLKKVRAAYLLPRCFCVTLCVLDSRSVRSKFDIGIIRMG